MIPSRPKTGAKSLPRAAAIALPERQRGAAGRVDLGAMMDLDHLGVEVLEDRGDLADDLRQHVDADTHVGRDYGARASRASCARPIFHLGREAGRADHDRGAFIRRDFEMLERRGRGGEIDRDGIGAGKRGVVVRDRDTPSWPAPASFARVAADGRRPARLDRAGQLVSGIGCDKRDQHPAHPACRAGDDEISHGAD